MGPGALRDRREARGSHIRGNSGSGAVLKVLEPVGSRLAGDEPAPVVEATPHVPLREQIPGLDAALAAHRTDAPAFLFG